MARRRWAGLDGHRTSGRQHGGPPPPLLLPSWVVGLDRVLGLSGGRGAGDWLSVVLLLLVFKVLVCVGAVAVTGVRVVTLVVELDATRSEVK